jgi:hypothetical protein
LIEAPTIDAASTIGLLEAIEALYPMLALIHVFLDNARYHHPPDHGPGVVQEWLSRPGCRIKLHFIPVSFCGSAMFWYHARNNSRGSPSRLAPLIFLYHLSRSRVGLQHLIDRGSWICDS